MNAATYLFVGYALGALVGCIITFIACRLHYRQRRTWKSPFNTDYTP